MPYEWLLAPTGPRERMFLIWVIYTLVSYAYLVWAHRFSIRATGVREATYAEAISVCVAEFVVVQVMSFFGFGPPWLFFALWFATRVATFKVFFKAEFGKAVLGAFVSTALSVFFNVLLVILIMMFFKRLPF